MSYPKNAIEWWALFDNNKNTLRSLVAGYYPDPCRPKRSSAISAPGAEAACEVVRQELIERLEEPALVQFDFASDKRDGPRMLKLLNGAWFGLPESHDSRDVPGFDVLCDLCSEGECVCLEEEVE